jgi:hypothetical protein
MFPYFSGSKLVELAIVLDDNIEEHIIDGIII